MKTKKKILEEIPEIIQYVEVKQRRRFKITLIVLVVLVPTLIFITYKASEKYFQYIEMRKRDVELKKMERRLEELKSIHIQIDLGLWDAKESLYRKSHILNNKFTDDLDLTTKYINENPRYQKQSELLNDILSMQKENVRWESGGLAPEEGFNSPSFIAFILEKHGLLGKHRAIDVWYRLEKVIPETDSPSMGDVVFYEYGYTMFYFMTDSGVPFVVGMTPRGIFALKEDFIEKIGYGKINYTKQ